VGRNHSEWGGDVRTMDPVCSEEDEHGPYNQESEGQSKPTDRGRESAGKDIRLLGGKKRSQTYTKDRKRAEKKKLINGHAGERFGEKTQGLKNKKQTSMLVSKRWNESPMR